MSGNTLQKAIDLVTKATEEDKNKNYDVSGFLIDLCLSILQSFFSGGFETVQARCRVFSARHQV